MKATCPSCGFGGGIEAFLADAEWRSAVLASAALPSDCGVLAARYIGMFRPAKRALSPSRAARLFNDINGMILNGIEFDRQTIKAPSQIWAAALQAVLDSPTLRRPLKDHNYLLRITQTKLAARADGKQDDRATARRSAGRVDSGLRHVGPSQPETAGKPNKFQQLNDEDKQRWLKKAWQALLDDGFDRRFMAAGLIEQKATEMLMEANNGPND